MVLKRQRRHPVRQSAAVKVDVAGLLQGWGLGIEIDLIDVAPGDAQNLSSYRHRLTQYCSVMQKSVRPELVEGCTSPSTNSGRTGKGSLSEQYCRLTTVDQPDRLHLVCQRVPGLSFRFTHLALLELTFNHQLRDTFFWGGKITGPTGPLSLILLYLGLECAKL